MVGRRALGLLGFGTAAAVGGALYRRSAARRRERVDVYYDDGSMLSLVDGSPEADRLLAAARTALAAAPPSRRHG